MELINSDKLEIKMYCEKCGSEMLLKDGRYGKYMFCSDFPTCEYKRPISIGFMCPEKDCYGEIVERRPKGAGIFYGCTRYPKCEFTLRNKPINEECPHCNHPYLVKKLILVPTNVCPIEKCIGHTRSY